LGLVLLARTLVASALLLQYFLTCNLTHFGIHGSVTPPFESTYDFLDSFSPTSVTFFLSQFDPPRISSICLQSAVDCVIIPLAGLGCPLAAKRWAYPAFPPSCSLKSPQHQQARPARIHALTQRLRTRWVEQRARGSEIPPLPPPPHIRRERFVWVFFARFLRIQPNQTKSNTKIVNRCLSKSLR